MCCLSIGSYLQETGRSFVNHLIEEIKIGDIGEEINKGILQSKKYFCVGDIKLLLTDAIIVSWIAIIIMIIFCLSCTAKAKLVPNKKQTLLEMLVELIVNTGMSFGMHKDEAEKVAPMIGTFAFVITGCNVISFFKLSPPAKNIAFPVAMALFAIIYVVVMSIRFVGLKGFWASLTSPMPMMLPFKILDFLIKPVSLSLRLFGNVFGGFVFMEFLSIIVPIILPGALGLWFDIADGILQAIVFSYLIMSYIGEVVEIGHEVNEERLQDEKKNVLKEEVSVSEM